MKPSMINEGKAIIFQEEKNRNFRRKVSRLTAKLVCAFIQFFKGRCIDTSSIRNPNEQTRTVKRNQAGVC